MSNSGQKRSNPYWFIKGLGKNGFRGSVYDSSRITLFDRILLSRTGYKLYPYFGGDEVAPHEITIQIQDIQQCKSIRNQVGVELHGVMSEGGLTRQAYAQTCPSDSLGEDLRQRKEYLILLILIQ